MQASDLLRVATAAEHKAAEARLKAASIMDGSLTKVEFTDMIRMHHQAWSAVEHCWVEDSTGPLDTHDFLLAMVEELRRDLAIGEIPAPAAPRFPEDTTSAAVRYGALYVLRGSTLGGTMINRKLRDCKALKELPAFHFHAACEALPGQEWRAFLRDLNAAVQTEPERAAAIAGAKAVFNIYLA